MESVFRIILVVILFVILTSEFNIIINHVYDRFRTVSSSSPRKSDSTSILADATSTKGSGNTDDFTKESLGKTYFAAPSDEESEENYDLSSKSFNVRKRLVHTIKTSCLPKLICELNASPHKEALSESEKSLLTLIRDTSISTTAEVTSRYHFAAHMGQLIAGIDSNGCHNFYPSCPFPGLQVMSMMKKVQIR